MTTISPNRRRASTRAFILTLLGVGVVVLGLFLLVRSPLSSVLWRVLTPLSYVRTGAGNTASVFFAGFSSQERLAAENASLRAALASTSVLLLDRSLLYTENSELRSRLGRAPQHVSPILASVTFRPPATPYDTLMIDVGSQHGVMVGDMVSAGGSVYVGKVSEVYATASRVVLFSAPGEKYNALLHSSAATSTLQISLAGQGGGSLEAQVPAGISVRAGDLVVFPTSAMQIAAKVVYVEEKEEGSFKTIYLQLPVNMYALQFVEVHHMPAVVTP